MSELFHGNLDLGNLAPQNIFKDTVSSFQNQPEWAQIAEIALPAIALGGVGIGALGAGAGGVAAEAGLGAAEAGGGALSGLTAADVSFLDPALTAADFAAGTPGAVAAAADPAAAFIADPSIAG